jgi:hypothetical protein
MWTGTILALSTALVLPAGQLSLPTSTVVIAWDVSGTKTDAGAIKSVDITGKSFVLTVGTGKDAKDITITFDDKTTYTLDGASSTMEKAMAIGHKASVKHTNNVAVSVDATTAK